ncbi:MAG TPA: FAD-dependent oxidoreductase, partial [Burkholderiales bacterium]|nr:FAD-dependent oxidoreductase [Burkholderiales bacterium]
MTQPSFDAIIVGTGQAGPSLAARLAGAGWKVAVVEKHKFGGTCVNNGCTPTKAMVASAYAAHVAKRAADYGVALDAVPHIDMKRVKSRKDEIVHRSSSGVEKWLEGLKGVTVCRGHARFASRSEIQVGSQVLRA